MTVTLELPNDLQREMEQEATRRGLPLAEYMLQFLVSHHPHSAEAAVPRTGAEIFAYWEREGLLEGAPEIDDPVQYARELRERNQNRRLD